MILCYMLAAWRKMRLQLLTHLALSAGKGRVKLQPWDLKAAVLWDLKVGPKAQAEVCSSGVFPLANELVENHLRKQNCPTKEITIYPFLCVFLFSPAVTTTLSSWSGHARKCNETAKSYCVNGGVCYYIEGINQLSCK